jgi:Fe2+ transport system protein FeoA
VKLADAPIGAQLCVESAPLDAKTTLRLGELGLRPGCVICVLKRTVFGGTVVACGGQRLALDKATAALVVTRPLNLAAAA